MHTLVVMFFEEYRLNDVRGTYPQSLVIVIFIDVKIFDTIHKGHLRNGINRKWMSFKNHQIGLLAHFNGTYFISNAQLFGWVDGDQGQCLIIVQFPIPLGFTCFVVKVSDQFA